MAIRGRFDTVDCSQCGEELVIKDHMKVPSRGVPAKRIHRQYKESIGSDFTLYCPMCKHYTTYSEGTQS